MFRNYILIAMRNLYKNKFYVLVNILGIGIAIACCIVAYYNVRFHYDFNNQHRKKDQIYKISLIQKINNRNQAYGITPLTLGPAIGFSIPGIKEVVRYANPVCTIKYGEHVYSKRIGFADANFFNVFDFQIISGDFTQLKNKNSILINRSLAQTCFGREEPLGKVNEYLKNLWAEIIPNEPYRGICQNQLTSEAKEVNQQIVKIFNFLAIVSILLSLVGLYTLVSLTIIRKTKEIGIRKVMGAPYRSLVKLINRDYIIILFIACIFGGYLGYFASGKLMRSVWKYYMDISLISLLIPIFLIISISVVTIFRKVYLAANQNPVESLKYE